MARRRARSAVAPAAVPDALPVSARVGWSYLAALLAAVGAVLLVALANQTLAAVACASAQGGDDAAAGCRLGVAIWVGVAGFALCLLPALLLLRLDVWLWATLVALVGLLIALDAVTAWWWWLAAALAPAVASLASADGGRPALRRAQFAGLVTLVVATALLLVRWFLNG